MMKFIFGLIAVLFLASAVVQFNDPDPLFWVALYGAIGIMAIFAVFGKFNPWIILLGLAVCAFELFRLLPAFWTWVTEGTPSIVGSMKAESPHIELVREFLGLAISIGALLIFYFRARKQRLLGARSA